MSTTTENFTNGTSGNSSPLSNTGRSTTLPSNISPQAQHNSESYYMESNLDRRSVSQFNPATLDTHSVHSRRFKNYIKNFKTALERFLNPIVVVVVPI